MVAGIAQRMSTSRDEKHTLLATFWFNIAHYTLRPWPWIIVGLVSMVAYPNLEDPEVGYPMIMLKYMPVGLLGIMMTSFLLRLCRLSIPISIGDLLA